MLVRRFQGVGAGLPRLQARVPDFDLTHRLPREEPGFGCRVAYRRPSGHQKQEEFVIFG